MNPIQNSERGINSQSIDYSGTVREQKSVHEIASLIPDDATASHGW